jgi:hypothetical protein
MEDRSTDHCESAFDVKALKPQASAVSEIDIADQPGLRSADDYNTPVDCHGADREGPGRQVDPRHTLTRKGIEQ